MASATGAETPGLVVAGLSYGFTHFGSHFSGSSSIDPVRTEAIAAHMFELTGEYHIERGLTAQLRLPVGTIGVDPVGSESTSVTGPGDTEIGAGYDLGRIWGLGGYRPSVRIRPALSLPTGTTRRVVDGDAPPNIISIGTGTIAAGIEVQASQYLSKSWAARARAAGRLPLGFNEEDIEMGAALTGSVGALFKLHQDLLLSADAVIRHRRPSRERVRGELVNSGGSVLSAQLAASYKIRDDVIAGLRGGLPVYTDVNGEQISESFGLGGFVVLTFGGGHDHGHSDGDGHGHEGGGDVAELASGGDSFELADAAVEGKVVAIDFWADWCHPCEAIDALLERRAAADAELAVRKVEVPSFDTPVAGEHLAGVGGLPVVWILDRRGRVVDRLDQVTPGRLERALDRALGARGH